MTRATIKIKSVPAWKQARGHQAHRSGAGTHGDKRTKRQRTRSAKMRAAIHDA